MGTGFSLGRNCPLVLTQIVGYIPCLSYLALVVGICKVCSELIPDHGNVDKTEMSLMSSRPPSMQILCILEEGHREKMGIII